MEFTKEETDILRSCLDGNISKISELPIDSQYKLLYYIDNVLKNDDLFNNIYKFLDFNLGDYISNNFDNRNFDLKREEKKKNRENKKPGKEKKYYYKKD